MASFQIWSLLETKTQHGSSQGANTVELTCTGEQEQVGTNIEARQLKVLRRTIRELKTNRIETSYHNKSLQKKQCLWNPKAFILKSTILLHVLGIHPSRTAIRAMKIYARSLMFFFSELSEHRVRL